MKKLILLTLALTLCSFSAGAEITTPSTTTPSAMFGDTGNCANATNGTGGLTDTITFVESANLTDVDISVEFTHSFRSDLQFHINYDGTDVVLALDDGGLNDNYFATFDSDSVAGDCAALCNDAAVCDTLATAATCTPDEDLAAFDGKLSDIAGGWTLVFCDDAGGDEGTLDNWSVTLDGPPPLPVELLYLEIE